MSKNTITLLNLNWGYQIVRGNIVMAIVRDAESWGGPHRSPTCEQRARELHAGILQLCANLDNYSDFIAIRDALAAETEDGWVTAEPNRLATNTLRWLAFHHKIEHEPPRKYRLKGAWRRLTLYHRNQLPAIPERTHNGNLQNIDAIARQRG